MTNNFYILGFLWYCLGGSTLLSAQSRPIPTGVDYTYLEWLSEETDAQVYCKDTICQNYLDTLEHLSCQHDVYLDGFYPIGWSRAGAFAYVHYKNSGDRLTDYEIKIIDSPKRKIKDHKAYATSITPVPVEDYKDIDDLWKREERSIHLLLQNNQIQSIPITFRPISLAKNKLTLRQNQNTIDQTIDSYKLILHTNGKEIILSTYKHNGRKNKIKNIEIVGWIPSPYTSKATIVIAFEEIVAPQVINYTYRLVVVNW